MFERLTTDARAVVTTAVTEAEHRSDRHVGTEHVLLALTSRSGQDPAVHLLTRLGTDLAALRADLEWPLAAAA